MGTRGPELFGTKWVKLFETSAKPPSLPQHDDHANCPGCDEYDHTNDTHVAPHEIGALHEELDELRDHMKRFLLKVLDRVDDSDEKMKSLQGTVAEVSEVALAAMPTRLNELHDQVNALTSQLKDAISSIESTNRVHREDLTTQYTASVAEAQAAAEGVEAKVSTAVQQLETNTVAATEALVGRLDDVALNVDQLNGVMGEVADFRDTVTADVKELGSAIREATTTLAEIVPAVREMEGVKAQVQTCVTIKDAVDGLIEQQEETVARLAAVCEGARDCDEEVRRVKLACEQSRVEVETAVSKVQSTVHELMMRLEGLECKVSGVADGSVGAVSDAVEDVERRVRVLESRASEAALQRRLDALEGRLEDVLEAVSADVKDSRTRVRAFESATAATVDRLDERVRGQMAELRRDIQSAVRDGVGGGAASGADITCEAVKECLLTPSVVDVVRELVVGVVEQLASSAPFLVPPPPPPPPFVGLRPPPPPPPPPPVLHLTSPSPPPPFIRAQFAAAISPHRGCHLPHSSHPPTYHASPPHNGSTNHPPRSHTAHTSTARSHAHPLRIASPGATRMDNHSTTPHSTAYQRTAATRRRLRSISTSSDHEGSSADLTGPHTAEPSLLLSQEGAEGHPSQRRLHTQESTLTARRHRRSRTTSSRGPARDDGGVMEIRSHSAGGAGGLRGAVVHAGRFMPPSTPPPGPICPHTGSPLAVSRDPSYRACGIAGASPCVAAHPFGCPPEPTPICLPRSAGRSPGARGLGSTLYDEAVERSPQYPAMPSARAMGRLAVLNVGGSPPLPSHSGYLYRTAALFGSSTSATTGPSTDIESADRGAQRVHKMHRLSSTKTDTVNGGRQRATQVASSASDTVSGESVQVDGSRGDARATSASLRNGVGPKASTIEKHHPLTTHSSTVEGGSTHLSSKESGLGRMVDSRAQRTTAASVGEVAAQGGSGWWWQADDDDEGGTTDPSEARPSSGVGALGNATADIQRPPVVPWVPPFRALADSQVGGAAGTGGAGTQRSAAHTTTAHAGSEIVDRLDSRTVETTRPVPIPPPPASLSRAPSATTFAAAGLRDSVSESPVRLKGGGGGSVAAASVQTKPSAAPSTTSSAVGDEPKGPEPRSALLASKKAPPPAPLTELIQRDLRKLAMVAPPPLLSAGGAPPSESMSLNDVLQGGADERGALSEGVAPGRWGASVPPSTSQARSEGVSVERSMASALGSPPLLPLPRPPSEASEAPAGGSEAQPSDRLKEKLKAREAEQRMGSDFITQYSATIGSHSSIREGSSVPRSQSARFAADLQTVYDGRAAGAAAPSGKGGSALPNTRADSERLLVGSTQPSASVSPPKNPESSSSVAIPQSHLSEGEPAFRGEPVSGASSVTGSPHRGSHSPPTSKAFTAHAPQQGSKSHATSTAHLSHASHGSSIAHLVDSILPPPRLDCEKPSIRDGLLDPQPTPKASDTRSERSILARPSADPDQNRRSLSPAAAPSATTHDATSPAASKSRFLPSEECAPYREASASHSKYASPGGDRHGSVADRVKTLLDGSRTAMHAARSAHLDALNASLAQRRPKSDESTQRNVDGVDEKGSAVVKAKPSAVGDPQLSTTRGKGKQVATDCQAASPDSNLVAECPVAQTLRSLRGGCAMVDTFAPTHQAPYTSVGHCGWPHEFATQPVSHNDATHCPHTAGALDYGRLSTSAAFHRCLSPQFIPPPPHARDIVAVSARPASVVARGLGLMNSRLMTLTRENAPPSVVLDSYGVRGVMSASGAATLGLSRGASTADFSVLSPPRVLEDQHPPHPPSTPIRVASPLRSPTKIDASTDTLYLQPHSPIRSCLDGRMRGGTAADVWTRYATSRLERLGSGRSAADLSDSQVLSAARGHSTVRAVAHGLTEAAIAPPPGETARLCFGSKYAARFRAAGV